MTIVHMVSYVLLYYFLLETKIQKEMFCILEYFIYFISFAPMFESCVA